MPAKLAVALSGISACCRTTVGMTPASFSDAVSFLSEREGAAHPQPATSPAMRLHPFNQEDTVPAIATICPAPQPDSQLWLDAELDWAWLLAERRLLALQRDGLRPTEGDEVAEVDAILHRRQLAGAPGPDSDAAFANALASTRALARRWGGWRPLWPYPPGMSTC